MTGRSIDRRLRTLTIMLAPLLIAACADSNPRDTVFSWDLQSDPGAHADRDRQGDTDRTGNRSRAEPGWYENREPQRGDVTVGALPAPGQAGRELSGPATDEMASIPEDAIAFSWPLKGRIISDFGAGDDGQRSDGINIAAVYGTPIRAAAAGTVSYAGDELKNYGNLVLIRHANGYITAYAHAESLTVSKGDVVKQGQLIGYAGDSGGVSQPQLHFEIRRGKTPLDPRPFLEGQDQS